METVEPGNSGMNKKSIIYTILLTLLLGGSSPWWFDKIFSKSKGDSTETVSTETKVASVQSTATSAETKPVSSETGTTSTVAHPTSTTTTPIIHVPAENKSPIANPGNSGVITLPVNTLALDASASFDPDGQIVSYLWEKLSGPASGTIRNQNTAKAEAIQLVAGLYEFKLTVTDNKGEKDVKIKKVRVNDAPVQPPVKTSVNRQYNLNEFGTLGRSSNGDNEMDTDNGDIVPVKCTTEIIFSQSRVSLKVSYHIREDGGDHTTFNKTFQRDIFIAPSGKKIVDVKVAGNRYLVTFEQESRNENHNVTPFRNITNTYWRSLRFRVDGPGSDDDRRIGVGGTMDFTVVMEDILTSSAVNNHN